MTKSDSQVEEYGICAYVLLYRLLFIANVAIRLKLYLLFRTLSNYVHSLPQHVLRRNIYAVVLDTTSRYKSATFYFLISHYF